MSSIDCNSVVASFSLEKKGKKKPQQAEVLDAEQ